MRPHQDRVRRPGQAKNADVLVEIIETSRDNKAKGGVLFSER